jgi:hypothetical protein
MMRPRPAETNLVRKIKCRGKERKHMTMAIACHVRPVAVDGRAAADLIAFRALALGAFDLSSRFM